MDPGLSLPLRAQKLNHHPPAFGKKLILQSLRLLCKIGRALIRGISTHAAFHIYLSNLYRHIDQGSLSAGVSGPPEG